MTPDGDATFSEVERQAIVAAYPADNRELNGQLERLAALAARLCAAPMALVTLVEAERQVFIGRHGTSLGETPREDSFCAHAMLGDACMVVPDARQDPRFAENPLVIGKPGIRFYAGQPLKSAEGAPVGSFCVIDTRPREGLSTDEAEALETLALSVMGLLERERIARESAALLRRSAGTIDDLERRFEVLADAMPQLVWSTPPDGMSDYFNRQWCDYTGEPAQRSHGTGWLDFVHPDDLEATGKCWRAAVGTGESYEIEYRLRGADGAYRWMLARGEPMRDARGDVTRWIGTCTDIHEQKDDAERLALLSRELSHRIKNIFAVIGGLVSLTIRAQPEVAPAARDLQERILALGRAHDYVRLQGAEGPYRPSHSSLRGMLAELLAPYQDAAATRIAVSGEDIAIDDRSATPLALFFHELATNAAKHGALSRADGQVAISIAPGDEVRLEWCESGGPPVTPAAESGFGATLVEMSVVRQLGGQLDFEWRQDGIRVEARIPAAAMMR